MSSRFTSHAPHDTGVPAAAATSGRFTSKASGDLGEWKTGYTMASPPPHSPLPTCTPPAGHPHFPGPTGSPALRNSTGVAHSSPSHGAACSGSIEVLIKPRIPLQAKAPPWCWQAPLPAFNPTPQGSLAALGSVTSSARKAHQPRARSSIHILLSHGTSTKKGRGSPRPACPPTPHARRTQGRKPQDDSLATPCPPGSGA